MVLANLTWRCILDPVVHPDKAFSAVRADAVRTRGLTFKGCNALLASIKGRARQRVTLRMTTVAATPHGGGQAGAPRPGAAPNLRLTTTVPCGTISLIEQGYRGRGSTDSRCQMSRLYSEMVRSEEK